MGRRVRYLIIIAPPAKAERLKRWLEQLERLARRPTDQGGWDGTNGASRN